MTVSHARTFVASVLLVLRERQSGGLFADLLFILFLFFLTMFLFSFFFFVFFFFLLHNETFGPFIFRSASRQFIHKLNTPLRLSSSSALVGDSAPHRRTKTRCYIACGSRRCRIDEHVPVVLFCSNESRLCGDQ